MKNLLYSAEQLFFISKLFDFDSHRNTKLFVQLRLTYD